MTFKQIYAPQGVDVALPKRVTAGLIAHGYPTKNQ